jgi:hypothetical protein
MYQIHLSYIQQDLTNPEKMEIVISIKVHCNVLLPKTSEFTQNLVKSLKVHGRFFIVM